MHRAREQQERQHAVQQHFREIDSPDEFPDSLEIRKASPAQDVVTNEAAKENAISPMVWGS